MMRKIRFNRLAYAVDHQCYQLADCIGLVDIETLVRMAKATLPILKLVDDSVIVGHLYRSAGYGRLKIEEIMKDLG